MKKLLLISLFGIFMLISCGGTDNTTDSSISTNNTSKIESFKETSITTYELSLDSTKITSNVMSEESSNISSECTSEIESQNESTNSFSESSSENVYDDTIPWGPLHQDGDCRLSTIIKIADVIAASGTKDINDPNEKDSFNGI